MVKEKSLQLKVLEVMDIGKINVILDSFFKTITTINLKWIIYLQIKSIKLLEGSL